MKHIQIDPAQFSGEKFAIRYGLDSFRGDFSINGNILNYPDSLPDSPIIEPPDPPIPQGKLRWEAGPLPGTVRLLVDFNGKSSTIVVAGQDTSVYAMYTSPGPHSKGSLAHRHEYHLADKANISELGPLPVDGDTLYVLGTGEYRRSNNTWRRVLPGPDIGSLADKVDLYADLDDKLDAAINPPQGPQIDARVKAVLVELRKLI